MTDGPGAGGPDAGGGVGCGGPAFDMRSTLVIRPGSGRPAHNGTVTPRLRTCEGTHAASRVRAPRRAPTIAAKPDGGIRRAHERHTRPGPPAVRRGFAAAPHRTRTNED
ncbi:hypothetical protein Sya03_07310 [Spirilliplanes yamanashiensis]|uniref:Uncharacterized protein n=1 Tax=Spirilliplanes yamanashiensis TaxID=42233 RepID=A0A8J4DH97_9ACTN|nr:hypothetical protein Sya03_07310 [Spirilliplanes yamanashiensis]